MELRISTGFWQLDSFSDRFVPGGYQEEIDWKKQLEILSRIDGLDGFAPVYPAAPLPDDPVKLEELLKEYGFEVADIYVDVNSGSEFKDGAFCSTDTKIREKCIDISTRAMDFAAALPGVSITLWPGHDGFDYPFQVDYLENWMNMVDTFQAICAHNQKVQVNLEYKQKDPRQKFFINSMGTMLLFFQDVGADNLKGVLDTGHALISQENLAESAAQLCSRGKLGTVHNNDNYRDADSDMLFSSIAFWDNIEFYYYLNRTDWTGWNEIETFLPRGDRVKCADLTVKMVQKSKEMADRLFEKRDIIDKNLKGYRFIENMDLITELLL
jgi:xylose isomerase